MSAQTTISQHIYDAFIEKLRRKKLVNTDVIDQIEAMIKDGKLSEPASLNELVVRLKASVSSEN